MSRYVWITGEQIEAIQRALENLRKEDKDAPYRTRRQADIERLEALLEEVEASRGTGFA